MTIYSRRVLFYSMSMRPMLAALLLTTVILFYFPAIVYRENTDFFESSFRYISLLLLPVAIVITGLFWSFSLFLSAKWKERYGIFLASVAVTGWFIGIFLVFNVGLLDGQQQLQSHSGAYKWGELGGALLALGVLVAAGWKRPRVFGKAVTFLMFVIAGVVLITVMTDKKKYAMVKNSETTLRASAQKNVFVFVFDSFQSNVFEEIANENPALRKELDGFTFFKNTASAAPTTYLSMPAIHSAALYTPDQSIPECYEEAIRKNSFLARLSSKGYETSMINSIGPCPKGASCGRLGQATGDFWSPVIRDASELIDISLYRFAPALFKDAIYGGGKWWVSSIFKVQRIFPNISFLKDLSERLFPTTDRPVARFIHLYITHPPALVNEDCEFIQPQKWNWKSVKAQSRCSVNLFVNFLQSLKKRDLYDRSAILLLSDHGAGLMTGNENRMMAKAKALLLIKPFQTKGEMKTSGKLMHVGDIPKTVCRLTGDCAFNKGDFAYDDVITGRSVPFLEYRWKHEYWYTQSVPIDAVWKISGPVGDIFSWNREITTGELNVSHLDFSEDDPQAAFGFGWSRPGTNQGRTFRRAGQSLAQIFLPLKRNQQAKIQMTVLTDGEVSRNPAMILYLDQKRIAEKTLPVKGWEVISFDLPAETILNAVSRLTFQIRYSAQRKARNRYPAVIFDKLDVLNQ